MVSPNVSLNTFSVDGFNGEMERADEHRKETVELLEMLDQQLLFEYSQSNHAQEAVYGQFSALLDATAQGGEIQPINFDAHAYRTSDAHDLKDAAEEARTEYLNYKEEQEEIREMRAEAERLAPGLRRRGNTVARLLGKSQVIMITGGLKWH